MRTGLLVLVMLMLGCARAPDELPFSKADVRAHADLAEWLKL